MYYIHTTNIRHWDQNSFSAIKWSQLDAQWTFLRFETGFRIYAIPAFRIRSQISKRSIGRRAVIILLQKKNFGPNVIYFVLGYSKMHSALRDIQYRCHPDLHKHIRITKMVTESCKIEPWASEKGSPKPGAGHGGRGNRLRGRPWAPVRRGTLGPVYV